MEETAGGLEDALRVTDGNTSTRLQILNLSGNLLTVRALSKLATSIRAAGHDLAELDISNNNISVKTAEDAHHWELFLRSLGACQVLKSFSLTGNDLSGCRALEVFARVWNHQFHKYEGRLDQYFHDDSGDSAVALLDVGENFRTLSIKMTSSHSSPKKGFAVEPPVLGLPSIETIDMSNSAMTDGGALFLSYIVAQHVWAQGRLGLRSMNTNGFGPMGITYLPNPGFTSVGVKLMKQAQAVHYDPFEASEAPFGPENSPVGRIEVTPGSQSR